MKKILIVLIGNVIYDARVSKEIDSLMKFGYQVVLVQSESVSSDLSFPYKLYVIPKRRSGRMSFSKIIDIIIFSSKLRRIIHVENPDYIHCNDISALIYAIRFINKKKVVYDSHELATECASGVMKLIIRKIESFLIPKLHAIIIPQIDRLNYFGFLYPKSINKLYLIENFPTKFAVCEDDLFNELFQIDRGERKIVLYTGALNDERRVKELVYAVKDIKNIILVLIGFASQAYKDDLLEIIINNDLHNQVYLFDPIEHGKIKKLAGCADIGVCLYDDPNLNSYFCASNKLYELMDSGVLVLSNNTVGAYRVINEENGVCVNTTSIHDIRKGLLLLSEKEKAPKMNYWWENQENVLCQIYK